MYFSWLWKKPGREQTRINKEIRLPDHIWCFFFKSSAVSILRIPVRAQGTKFMISALLNIRNKIKYENVT